MSRTSYGNAVGPLLAFAAAAFVALTACVSDDPPPPPAAPTCEEYCNVIAKNCDGDKIQYRDPAECMKACSLLDLGTANDGDVNSIGCRIRKAKTATTIDDCKAAGPFGADVCGRRCSAFCTIVAKNCFSLENPIYGGSEGTCNETCGTSEVHFDPNEGEGPLQEFLGNNSLNCRSHHLILSIKSPADAVTHCPHAGVDSATCKR